MSDFGRSEYPTAAKDHRCEYCYGRIPKGEEHVHFTGVYEGEWQNWRMHRECSDDFDSGGEFEFVPGAAEMPERVKALRVAP